MMMKPVALALLLGTAVMAVPQAMPPSPISNSVRICQEPCYIVSVSDPAATIFRFALGTSTGAPVGKYGLKNAAAYTVVYTYVATAGGLQHTVTIPAYVTPLTITGATDSNGVFTPVDATGHLNITWPLPAQ